MKKAELSEYVRKLEAVQQAARDYAVAMRGAVHCAHEYELRDALFRAFGRAAPLGEELAKIKERPGG